MLPLARTQQSRFNIPLPDGVNPDKIGVKFNTLNSALYYAAISYLLVDNKYSEGEVLSSGLYSYHYRLNKLVHPMIPHPGVWATAHLGLNIPKIEQDIVPKQTRAKSSEEAWAKSLDRIIREAVFRLGFNELLINNQTGIDYTIMGCSSVLAFINVLMDLPKIYAQNPNLLPFHYAGDLVFVNALMTLLMTIGSKKLQIPPVEGYRFSLFTPEFDNLLSLAIKTKFSKYISSVTPNPPQNRPVWSYNKLK